MTNPKSIIPTLILAIAGLVSTPINAEEAVVLGDSCDRRTTSVSCDAAFRVDLVTGKRTLFSALSTGKWEHSIIASSGDIFVSVPSYQGSGGGIYRIAPTDGSSQLISNISDITSGPTLDGWGIMAITPTNQILTPVGYQIISINPATGQRIMLSDSRNTTQGPSFEHFMGMDPGGRFWGNDGRETLVQFDPNTGIRTILKSGNSNYGYSRCLDFNYHTSPTTVVLDSADNLFGTVEDGGYLLQCNASNLVADPLSDFRNPTQGPIIERTVRLAWGSGGRIILLDDGSSGSGSVNLGGIYAIDPNTGNRTLISNFLDQNQGPLVYRAQDLAVGTMPAFVGNAGNGGNTGGNGGNGGGSSSGITPILNQTESADQVPVNQPFSYTVNFTNYAPSVATSVKLTDTLPQKAKLLLAVPSQGKCKGKAPVVCNFGTVASGDTVTATFTVTRKKPGQVKNSAFITYKMLKTGSKKMKSYKLVAPSKSTTVN